MKKVVAMILVVGMMFGSVGVAAKNAVSYEALWEASDSMISYYQTIIKLIRTQYEQYGELSDSDFGTLLIALCGYTNERNTKLVTYPFSSVDTAELNKMSFKTFEFTISTYLDIAEGYYDGEASLSETMDSLLRIYDAANKNK